MSIGMETEKGEVHSACYDLLASEARTAAFIAVAKDEVPQETWFLLARTHIAPLGHPVLLSWECTMFEYLMPALWMRTYHGTLLDRSRHAAVEIQREFTAPKRIPWGISESAYAARDEEGTYQYHAFGVPHLALHHGDVDALVISPYSTALALTTAPKQALTICGASHTKDGSDRTDSMSLLISPLRAIENGGTSSNLSAAGWLITRA